MLNRFVLTMLAACALPVAALAQAGPPQDRYIVVLSEALDRPADVAGDIAIQTGGQIGYVYETVLRGFTITMPRAALAGVTRDPRVAYVEEDKPISIVGQQIPTGVARIFADTNGDLDIDGTDDYRVDVDVAVLDTGIDYEHPDLYVYGGVNCLNSSGVFWNRTYSCEGDKTSADDGHSHGTHVAGTIGAIDNGIGVVGVAPGARLWAVKVLDDQGSGSVGSIVAGIDCVADSACIGDDIEVINMSLGGSGSSQAMDDAIEAAVEGGIIVVVAAGNSDDEADNYTPANSPQAFTVSALADFDGDSGGLSSPTCRPDQDDTLADFSNWSNLGVVDMAAPGVCILSTVPIEDGSYAVFSGTSMASPHVAAAAALLASGNNSPQNRADVEEIRRALESAGNLDWTDDSGDNFHEPLLDVSTFSATLIASDDSEGGGGDSNSAPTASFTYSCMDLACDFDGTGSSDSDGSVSNYDWDFGDGDSGTGSTVNHTYGADGDYIVSLTVTDDGGKSDSTSQSVSVSSGGGGGDGGSTVDACDGLADGVHLHPSSTGNLFRWKAVVDAMKCVNEDLENFTKVEISWNPLDGRAKDDCSTSTAACQATQSRISNSIESVDFTLNETTITVYKP